MSPGSLSPVGVVGVEGMSERERGVEEPEKGSSRGVYKGGRMGRIGSDGREFGFIGVTSEGR